MELDGSSVRFANSKGGASRETPQRIRWKEKFSLLFHSIQFLRYQWISRGTLRVGIMGDSQGEREGGFLVS